MPRQAGTKIQNQFIGGLITERTALSFPENAATDSLNVRFKETGEVTRRMGFDLEDDYNKNIVNESSNEVYTSFLWQSVANSGTLNFLVVQKGDKLYFFDVSEPSEPVSANRNANVVDLSTVEVASLSAINYVCQFSSGNGDLLVTNRACNPIYITYDISTNTMTTTEILIKIRDFAGLNDGLADNNRPTSTVAALITSNPKHYYNLLNQGWFVAAADPLIEWDTARTDLPSNSDVFYLYRASETDSFDNNRVLTNSYGSRLAPKGHFILDAFNPDRETALTNDGFTANPTGSTGVEFSEGALTKIGNMTGAGGLAASFDGNVVANLNSTATESTSNSATSGYVGLNLSASPKIIYSVTITPYSDVGFASYFVPLFGGYVIANDSITLTVYVKATAPASATDGTSIGTTTFSNSSAPRTIISTDTTNDWEYVWVTVSDSTGRRLSIAEVQIYEFVAATSDPDVTTERPTCISFFSGRVFYGGVSSTKRSNSIYFSQIIENRDQYGRCYQKNDPTSEDFFDLLSDDGGVVVIPDMGLPSKLFSVQKALLCFANNGTWSISGSPFSANEYSVSKISSVGTLAPNSFVDVRGIPFWWAEDGIYSINYNADYDSITANNITDATIRSLILSIPNLNRRYVSGSFDAQSNEIVWAYNSSEDLQVADYYKYDSFIVYNTLSNAFYTWSTDSDATPEIRGVASISNSDSSESSTIRYITSLPVDTGINALTFSKEDNDLFYDWTKYSVLETEDPDDQYDYSSYFITGFQLDGQTQRNIQSNYIFVFLEQQDYASCFVQGIFDFTSSGDSGRWSSRQQIYNEDLLFRNINFRKLRIRGHGKALQLRFTSESGKPFTIIGWSLYESISQTV